MQDSLSSLLERVSAPATFLEEPAPNQHELEQIIQAAICAPDHGALRPWRFLTIAGHARHELGEVFCQAATRQKPDLTEAELDAIRQKPLRAPMIVAVVAAIKQHPKIPLDEQIWSAAAATQNMLLAANALGYGSVWLTGPFAGNEYVCRRLGLVDEERIVAFVYLGTLDSEASALSKKKLNTRPLAANFLYQWDRPL